ncbi:MAG: DEDD exonuclease domain-containing protein [Acidimicrobiia bacterium]
MFAIIVDVACTGPLAPALPGFASTPAAPPGPPRQQTLDDLGMPLSQVTFVVVDLETTGTSPAIDAVTEIGALRMRGGELLGRFETFVNPGVPIPPMITVLTGITEAMLLPAPRIGEVLPAFLEFAHGAVLVGHNLRFDTGFLDAALAARGYPRLAHRRVDTVALARRLIRDEVPNLRLGTLARHFRTAVEPVHRAYADAAATAEVLHALLERASAFGVLGLDDLLALPTMRAHPSAAKLALTSKLPRLPGVYLFRDRGGRVLYVGKATNLRARVRSYFSTEDRRKVPQLLRETAHIEHRVCRGPFEAAVRELRLIQQLEPRFNRESKSWRRYSYLKLTDERFPRLVVSRVARADGASYLGPFRSSSAAHRAREAIEDAVPIRRCGAKIARKAVLECAPPCVPAQLGVSSCPCRAQIGDESYAALADVVRRGIHDDPAALCAPLEARMRRLADVERYEEAAATRERLATLTQALQRQRAMDALRAAQRLVIDSDEGQFVLAYGRVVLDELDGAAVEAPDLGVPPVRAEADELMLVSRWLHQARHVRCHDVVGVAATRLPALPSYAPLRDG